MFLPSTPPPGYTVNLPPYQKPTCQAVISLNDSFLKLSSQGDLRNLQQFPLPGTKSTAFGRFPPSLLFLVKVWFIEGSSLSPVSFQFL